jgi:hypothetical protein
VFLNALILPDYIQVVNKKHAFSPLAAIIKSFCGGICAKRKAPCAMRAPPGRRRQIQVQKRRLKGKNWGRLEFVSLVLGFTIGTGV